MTDEDRLRDMLLYARRAVRVMAGRDLDAFLADETAILATERAVEVLGEAANRVGEATGAGLPEVPWRDIRGIRHVLAHAYASIDHDLLHRVVRDDLPPLIASLERRLGDTP